MYRPIVSTTVIDLLDLDQIEKQPYSEGDYSDERFLKKVFCDQFVMEEWQTIRKLFGVEMVEF